MEKQAHTNLRDFLREQKENNTLRVMEANETLKDPQAFMDSMKEVREDYERKSADSVRVLRDKVLI